MTDEQLEILTGFIDNAALVLLLVVAYQLILARLPRQRMTTNLLAGLGFGLIAVLGIVLSIRLIPGLVFDARTVILSLGTLFAGPVAGVIAGLMALVTRVALGGSGVHVGSAVIIAAVLIGVAGYRLRISGRWVPGPWSMFGFGLLIHVVTVGLFGFLPSNVHGPIFDRVLAPFLLILPIVSFVGGMLMLLIEERQRRLQDLSFSDDLFGRMESMAKIGGWKLDVASGTGRWTREVAKLHEIPYQQQPVKLDTGLSFYQGEYRAALEQAIKQAIDRGEAFDLELEMVTPSGKRRWVRTIGEPVYRNGRVVELQGAFQDLSERRLSQQALSQSEEKFTSAFYSSPAALTITRVADGEFIEVNEAFLRLFEYQREEVIGHTSLDLNMLSKEERSSLIAAQRASDGLRNTELKAYAKSGKVVNLMLSSRPMELNGEACHVTVMIDITERKEAEQKLAESEQQYRALFENMNDGFVLFEVVQDAGGIPIDLKIVAANSGFGATTGLVTGEVIGKHLTDVLPGIENDAADWIGTYAKIALSGQAKQFENPSERTGFHYSVSAYQAGPGHCGVVFRDITKRKQKEEELRQRNSELERFNLASVDRELDMIALKKRVNELSIELGQEPPFNLETINAAGLELPK